MAITRRSLLVTAFCLAVPSGVYAQQSRQLKKLGILSPRRATEPDSFAVTLEELRKLGWAVGANLSVERRYSERDDSRLLPHAEALVAWNPDVILTATTPSAIALQKATSTIPIVAAGISDPVETKLVASMRRPGANITGFSSFSSELAPKRLELLKEIAPRIRRIAVLTDSRSPASSAALRDLNVAASTLRLALTTYEVRPENLERVLVQVKAARTDALFITGDTPLRPLTKQIADFAVSNKLPTAFGYREQVTEGGLLAYTPNYDDIRRRAAIYVDKIFRGAKAGDLPIEQPTRIELWVNARTAKTLGLNIPPTIAIRIDKLV